MEKIILPRGKGKTLELVKRSAEPGHYIVCASMQEAAEVKRQAKEAGYDIPLPLSYLEFTGRQYYEKGVNGLLIDDADRLLQWIAGNVPVVAITMRDE